MNKNMFQFKDIFPSFGKTYLNLYLIQFKEYFNIQLYIHNIIMKLLLFYFHIST